VLSIEICNNFTGVNGVFGQQLGNNQGKKRPTEIVVVELACWSEQAALECCGGSASVLRSVSWQL
jgi:hypothetical protein